MLELLLNCTALCQAREGDPQYGIKGHPLWLDKELYDWAR